MVVINLKARAHFDDSIMQATAIYFPISATIPHFLNYLFRVSENSDPDDVFFLDQINSKKESKPFGFVVGFSSNSPSERN